MKELIVRSISGLLYISIIIFSLFAPKEWFFALFFILAIITINEYQKLVRLKYNISYIIFSVLYFFLSYKVINKDIVNVYAILAIITNLFLSKELFKTKKSNLKTIKKHLFLLFYIFSGFIFLVLIPSKYGDNGNKILINLFALFWTNDSFAYFIGKNLGKHKLFERISPKKTIEGFIGGLIGTLTIAFIIFNYSKLFSLGIWICLAVLVTALGTIGDLIQSKFKRLAGVKDSGTIMPGHGGIYDRLDSMIYSSPFIYVFLEIVADVS